MSQRSERAGRAAARVVRGAGSANESARRRERDRKDCDAMPGRQMRIISGRYLWMGRRSLNGGLGKRNSLGPRSDDRAWTALLLANAPSANVSMRKVRELLRRQHGLSRSSISTASESSGTLVRFRSPCPIFQPWADWAHLVARNDGLHPELFLNYVHGPRLCSQRR